MISQPSAKDWQAPTKPQWLQSLAEEEICFDMDAVVPLDPTSLIYWACKKTGLSDFGEDYWREPFEILCQSLDSEADLTLMGRLMARNDILLWLQSRLQVLDIVKQHPEILEEEIKAPVVIVGLPRSGTSILFEVLSQDQQFGVPQAWEAIFPCPPPEAASYDDDPRIARAHAIETQWNRVCPEFATMHEMGGKIPAECGHIMAGSFISDHIAALHQSNSYAGFYATADLTPAYQYHKMVLQVLQWKNPRQRWLLKAPAHQNYLDLLIKTYPDVCIVQTHRDPIKSMASSTSMMGCLYAMRSDKPFDAASFEDFMLGEATAARLEYVMQQRETGVVPEGNIVDSRYQDLMDDPVACVEHIYAHFGIELEAIAKQTMLNYLADKPKGKFGKHDYKLDGNAGAERQYFARYQAAYNVPNEV